MTTRRRRSSNSGNAGQQPGSRAWRDSIQQIKLDLTADGGWLLRKLEEQDVEMVEQKQALFDQAESLKIQELLAYMNDNLLDGQGVIETTYRWHMPEVDDLNDEEEDEDDDGDLAAFPVLSVTLSWKQGGRVQVSVELADLDGDIELSVNEEDMDSATPRVLQQGLIDAFSEQLSFLEEVDEDE